MSKWQRNESIRVRHGGVDTPYQEIRTMNPSRGLNVQVADVLASDKEATEGSFNIEYNGSGIAEKRMGFTALVGSTLNAPARGLGEYISESTNYIMAADQGVLKKYQSGSFSILAGGITVDAAAPTWFTSLFQKTFAWDGINGGVVWDGAAVTRPGTMPKAKHSVIYKGYHVAFGVDGQRFRLYLAPVKEPSRFTNSIVPSDPNDVALNDAANVPGATVFLGDASSRAIDINKNDGQKVTGLGFFQDVLIVFKENSIYQLYFNSTNGFVVERISSSYGALCHGAVCSVENDCYFLTDKGVFVLGNEPNFYASIRTNELSSRIKTLLELITLSAVDSIRSWYHNDRYYLSVPINSSTPNAVVVYDRRFYAWSYWTGIAASSLLVFKDRDGDKKKHFYFADVASPVIQEFTPGIYNDNGVAIRAVFRTAALGGRQLDREKYWYILLPVFKTNTGEVMINYITERGSEGRSVTFNPSISGGLGTDQIGMLRFGTSQSDTYSDGDMGLSSTGTESSSTDSTHTVSEIGINIDSRVLKVEFINDTLNETFGIMGWVILFQTKDPQRRDGDNVIR